MTHTRLKAVIRYCLAAIYLFGILLPAAGCNGGNVPAGDNADKVTGSLIYRDYVEIGIGDSKQIIYYLAVNVPERDESTPLSFAANCTLGTMAEGVFQPLPERDLFASDPNQNDPPLIEVGIYYGAAGPPFWRNGGIINFITSPDIKPGPYMLWLEVEIPEYGLHDLAPLMLNVKKSADDIVAQLDGPVYRANQDNPVDNAWAPVTEATVALESYPSAELHYRDYVETRMFGYKSILFTLHPEGTELANAKVTYTMGVILDEEFKPLPTRRDNGDVTENRNIPHIEVFWNYPYRIPSDNPNPVTVIGLRSYVYPDEYQLWVQLEAEGLGVIGQVPLTFKVKQSWDDVLTIPGGPAYRYSVHGPDINVDEPFEDVKQTSVIIGKSG